MSARKRAGLMLAASALLGGLLWLGLSQLPLGVEDSLGWAVLTWYVVLPLAGLVLLAGAGLWVWDWLSPD